MKTIYKSILSLATLLACSSMPAWGEAYEIVTKFTADKADPKGNMHYFDAGNMQFNEIYERLVDGQFSTKWCCSNFTSGYIEFHHSRATYVYGYILTTANDNETYVGRNPDSWTLYGLNSTSKEWEKIHEVLHDKTMQDANRTSYTFMLPLPTQKKYRNFRLELEGRRGGDAMQLGELQMLLSDTREACSHPKLLYHAPVPATCSTDGIMEYWECPNPLCGLLFKDEAATQSATLSNLATTPNISSPHANIIHVAEATSNCTTQGHSEYWTCEGCKKVFSDAEGKTIIEDISSILKEPKFNTINKEIGSYSTTTSNCGYCPYYGYGGSQNLYLASEIGTATTIEYIEFYCESTRGSLARTTKVYMAETEQTNITPESFIPAAQFTLVFDGSFTLGSSTGWEKLTLDTPFAYSGKKNLVIGIYSGDYNSYKSNYYRVSDSEQHNAIYRENDDDSNYADITIGNNENQEYEQGGRPLLRLKLSTHTFADITNGISTCSICATKEEQESITTLTLDDTKPYIRKTDAQVSTLSYTRNFATADQWESIYLPFAFKYTEQMAAQFDLAEIDTYGVSSDTNEDGVIDSKDEKVLLIQQRETSVTFKANHPYLIRPKNTGNITFSSDDGTLYRAEENSVSCGTLRDQLSFCGNNAPTKCKGYYVMKNGYLTKVTDEDEVLSSFTWYMTGSSKFAASSINSIKIVERGEHIHYDNNDDGQCDDCGYELPLTLLSTAEECASYGLEDYYIGYYPISKYWQLVKAASMLEDSFLNSSSWDRKNYHFVLTDDIIANGTIFNSKGKLLSNLKEWGGAVMATDCILDGNGHSIKGLVYTKPEGTKVALFREMHSGAKICNLGIEDSYINYPYGGTSQVDLATFVANMKGGTIEDSWTNAKIEANVGSQDGNIGGIVGFREGGIIKNCTFDGSIKIENSNAAYIGGIVGVAMPLDTHVDDEPYDFSHCHFAGSITTSSVKYIALGGICGATAQFYINCCWSDGTISYENASNGYLGGIVGNPVAASTDNCGNYTELHGGKFYNCANMMDLSGKVTDEGEICAGGLVGISYSSYNSEFSNCLNTGTIKNAEGQYSNSGYSLQVAGVDDFSIKGRFYYLASERESQEGSTYIGYTTDDFQSGYAAREILAQCDGKYWGQNIGDDKYPVPDQENHQKVYAVEHNGTQYVNDSIAEFTVTEGYSFVNTDAKEFKAHQATYSRKMPNQWGTLCLPFSIDYDPDNTEMTLFKLTEITKEGGSDVLMFEEYAEGVIAGGTPLVVKLHSAKGEDDKYTLSIEEADATFAKDTKIISCGETNWLSKGNFVNDTIYYSATSDNYYIAANQFWYVDAGVVNGISMAPYRGWFEAPQTQNGAVRRFVIGEKSSDSSTNIQIVENEEEHSVRFIFNLAGQRQETLQKGLNIINNEKVLIK